MRQLFERMVVVIWVVAVNGGWQSDGMADESEGASIPLDTNRRIHRHVSVTVSGELDSNAKKEYTTSSSVDDGVVRFFVNTNGRYHLHQRAFFDVRYQGGAKKYIQESGEDTVINDVKVGYHHALFNNIAVGIDGNLKAKFERESGEDFYLGSGRGYLQYHVAPLRLTTEVDGKYTYFNFLPTDKYSFHRGRYGINFRMPVVYPVSVTWGYHFQQQYYLEPFLSTSVDNRRDILHEVTAFVGVDRDFIARVGMIFQTINSNVDALSNTVYRGVIQFSYLLPWDLTVLVLATVQLRKYASSTQENTGDADLSQEDATQALIVNAEEEYFNTAIIKVSKQVTKSFYIEAKYSRFSNEFSDGEDPFERDLYNIGVRYVF